MKLPTQVPCSQQRKVDSWLLQIDLFGLGTTGHTVPRETRMRQVVKLAIVEEILDAAIETFADRHVLPLVVSWVELLDV